ncbi:MAG: TonB-dependent receptor [Bacteroidetes bacterium]|jgi:outer membrane receptor for ferrienterochelin and colicin|nr:TonB-dependent receptor [Bacteroidota bacterium]
MRLKLLISLLAFVAFLQLNAQKGFIRGTVYDAETGEVLTGVTVLIEGTQNGTITDLDGKYSLSVNPGTHNINMSFISYEKKKIIGVEVQAGEATVLDDISMEESSVELTEVVVSASAVRNTENALMAIKRKSPNLMDGISASRLRKIGDSDAASAMKRVPGVSVSGSKYVFVRGLGDRYTKTTLNGVDIPGLDPDRNTLQMDIFPTNIVDNLIVHKSFSAEMPADFTGGLVDITIKDFPEEESGDLSLGFGYNPDFHFNSNYLTYKGGETDYLGFDDGTREIPATTDIPFFANAIGSGGVDSESGQRYREVLNSFNPTMAAQRENSFMDYSVGFSMGNQVAKEKVTLGYNIAVSYKNESEYFQDAEYGRYGLQSDKSIYEMEIREFQQGDFGVNNVFLSGLGGIAIKTSRSKYRLYLLHLQNGESKAGIFDYRGVDQGSVFDAFQHNLDYSQRSLSNLLLDGKHIFHHSKWEIEWKLSPTLSKLNAPDIRFTRYRTDQGSLSIGTESGFPERIWRELEEINIAGLVHLSKEFNIQGRKSKLLFGGGYTYKERDYIIRSFALNIRRIPLSGDPDELFREENLWPYLGDENRGTTYEAPFIPVNPNTYNSYVNNTSGYVSSELALLSRLKATIGIRVENYVQNYTGRDQQGNNILDDEEVLNNLDVFPSINLVYNILTNMNVRTSYTKTIARPSFKELSYAEIYDPITGRTFIGGLHRDDPDIVYWDGNLESTDIHNFDLRWELFMNGGQMVSLSGFYKKFNQPIEIVQYARQPGAFQPRNVGDGEVYGAEAEFRLNLNFISSALNNFSITSNVTVLNSRIELSLTELESREDNAREGEKIEDHRDMSGMAPYIINSGISFQGQQGLFQNMEAGFYYHVQGPTLEYVGVVDRPDIYAVPFHSLNFNSNKKFGSDGRFKAGIKIENILGESKEWVFQSYKAEDQFFEKYFPGTSFSLSLSYSFF